jgi:leucyl-tRNA synthetase
MTIAVQVNGKLRAELSLSTHTDEAAIMNAARSNEKVAAHTDGKEIVKSVYVPGKILNLVVK